MLPKYKKVILQIEVPNDTYCWNFKTESLCQHFDNLGGNITCDYGFHLEKILSTPKGYHKPTECLNLKNSL